MTEKEMKEQLMRFVTYGQSLAMMLQGPEKKPLEPTSDSEIDEPDDEDSLIEISETLDDLAEVFQRGSKVTLHLSEQIMNLDPCNICLRADSEE